jgi:uncharacterized DUF497 family protein
LERGNTLDDFESDLDIKYETEGLVFVWNKTKAESNKAKHGISFEEAASVFTIDGAEEFEDEEHSNDEDRLIVIGLSRELRVLTVVHCWRENDAVIRIISARKATQMEQILWKRW